MVTGITGLEGSIYAGLEALAKELLGREWQREDGVAMRIGKCLVDANWGNSTDVVYEYCRQSDYASVLTPSHGRFVGASSIPFSEYKRKPGEQVGHNWRLPSVQGRGAIRHIVYDTNFWKSFIYARLAVALGDPGALYAVRRSGRVTPIVHRASSGRVSREDRRTRSHCGRVETAARANGQSLVGRNCGMRRRRVDVGGDPAGDARNRD